MDGYKTWQYTSLQGYDSLVKQVWRRLRQLQSAFVSSTDFERSLQLLRLVAAPGLGKVCPHTKQGRISTCITETFSFSKVPQVELNLYVVL